MNRAILIVICDFLVSSMLSLMTGMVPAHTGGTGVGLDERTTRMLLAELDVRRQDIERLRLQLRMAARSGQKPLDNAAMDQLTQELIQNLHQSSKLQQRLKATPQNTGKLTPQQLQTLLERETQRRLAAEIAERDRQNDLKISQLELKHSQKDVKQLQKDLAKQEKKQQKTDKSLEQTSAALAKVTEEFTQAQKKMLESAGELNISKQKLAQAKAEVRAKDNDLAGMRDALREMNAKYGQISTERQSLRNTLAYTSGRLNTTERDLADYKGQLVRTRRTLSLTQLELKEAVRHKTEMGELLKKTVSELSSSEVKLRHAQTMHTAAVAKLKTTEKLYKEAVKGPTNNSLLRYSEGVVKLTVAVEEELMMLTQRGGGNYFLPLLQVGNRTVVAGNFNTLIGSADMPLLYRRISKLNYAVSDPDGKNYRALTTPLYQLGDIACFEIAPQGRKPLIPIDAAHLTRRGSQNLYLFRQNSFGKESIALGDRASIDLSNAQVAVVVRNTPGLPQAKLGDWLLTQEGEFVGIAVQEEKSAYQRRLVRFELLAPQLTGALRIPVVKQPGEKYYTEFGRAVSALRKRR